MKHKNIVISAIVIGIILLYAVVIRLYPGVFPDISQEVIAPLLPKGEVGNEVRTFSSKEDFQKYISESSSSAYGSGFSGVERMAVDTTMMIDKETQTSDAAASSRVSQTNVQVAGIDEPDIVKTDGKNLFLSSQMPYFYGRPMPLSEPMPMMELDAPTDETVSSPPSGEEEGMMLESISIDGRDMPEYYRRKDATNIIAAFPPEKMEKISALSDGGELLLYKDTLIVIAARDVFGYDVSDAKSPREKWRIRYEEENSFPHSARLKDDTLYLVSTTAVVYDDPCPMRPFVSGEKQLVIPCERIYHPVSLSPTTDSVYTISAVEAQSGEIKRTVSFTGSSNQSVISVFPENLYLAYPKPAQMASVMLSFLSENGSDLLPDSAARRIAKLASYDLSDSAKMAEINAILGEARSGLSSDRRLKFESELANRQSEYLKKHSREIETTGIVKVRLNDMAVVSAGSIPGRLLNQFSLDEYDGNLRVATTVGGVWMPFGRASEEVSDVSVLDGNLREVGSVRDLGRGERIYSVRFIGERGYVVTFKQIDPLFVLDLSKPSQPRLAGELEIPGYSAYLHPLGDKMLLGVGKEDQKVKISLFDVSGDAPREVAKYIVDEYYSEILSTHHAFLADEENKLFFLPGTKGGYLFSYEGETLSLAHTVSVPAAKRAVSLAHTVSVPAAKRAVYIGDYLYIIAENEVVAIDEKTGERVKALSL